MQGTLKTAAEQIVQQWQQELPKQSPNYHATSIDGMAWNDERERIMSSSIGYRLYRTMLHLEAGDFIDPAKELIPAIYRLGYAVALMDRLDGSCRIARHLELAGNSIETQQGSLHMMLPSIYSSPSDASAAAAFRYYAIESALTAEQIEINGECKMRAKRTLQYDASQIAIQF